MADNQACLAEADDSERTYHLPSKLLGAIAVVESGRYDAGAHRVVPWPWTVNVQGVGYFFPTKPDAVSFVNAVQQMGVQSIDVGCMQINLMYHPDAFTDLDQAFNPHANAHYAAHFLNQLYTRTQNWADAAASYHSQTPSIGGPYAARVAALLSWKLAPATPAPEDLRAALARKVDPLNVLTDQFRNYLVQVELDRLSRRPMAVVAGPHRTDAS